MRNWRIGESSSVWVNLFAVPANFAIAALEFAVWSSVWMEERLSEAGAGNSKAEDDFRSCCGDEEEWEDTEESFTAAVAKGELDETSVRLFFKGVSSPEVGGKKLSGIGVVMERSPGVPVLMVQKKLDFYVEELVAEHLALMDGLLVALQNGIRKIFAFTNSEKLYFQIAEAEILEDQLLVALGHRILELVDKLEDFDLILLPCFELERPLQLAKEAIGIRCGHEFCYSCGADYASGVQTCQCVFWDDEAIEPSSAARSSQAASEIWAWDTFDCMPTAVEGYSEQERAQLALIQRFLAGGFSLGDNPCQSPPRCADSYMVDTMKDLHQLPWLERFVSVISDSYNDDYIQ
nr:unnamed protein product [Digitaria exilis]